MLLSCGPPFICASLHGIVINTIQSLSSLDQFKDQDEVLKGLSLKMVELSHQRAYYLFGGWQPLLTAPALQGELSCTPLPVCSQVSQMSSPLPMLPCSRS